jgi:hypothetical protein
MNAPQVLTELFADYRAEWPQPYFASLFVPPPYFSKLERPRPCLLIGGRGTGKTTALKSLRFDAAETRLHSGTGAVRRPGYLGIYVRINKNRVRAFNAQEIKSELCARAFAHYINIAITQELCRLTTWLEKQAASPARPLDLDPVATAFGLTGVSDARSLLHALERQLTALELWVNNGGQSDQPVFSMAEAPLRLFVEILAAEGVLGGRQIYCCIDEYENLSNLQQAIVNTYLKHSEPPLSYKIGIRRDGLHTRDTIDAGDQIATPDDYVEIDIKNESFDEFAMAVVQHRLEQARKKGVNVGEVGTFLPELSIDDEAVLLGCERIATEVVQEIQETCPDLAAWASSIPHAKLYFLRYWEKSMAKSLCSLATDWQENPDQWKNRLNNYGYASLFWLSRGRKGARIRKYYSGVRTLISLASGNIRYFLEIIDSAINIQFEESFPRNVDQISIDPTAQTLAARAVGQRRLDQLEGLSERGVELKRLVLAIGKVFFELARDPVGRAPEQNSFVLSGSGDDRARASELLRNGVAHLAFEASPRTKSTSPELRDEEYSLHPIFCPFFEYSHRRKRRITLDAGSLLKLGSSPAQAIAEMLGNRKQMETVELPTQLAMFTDFYEGGKAK